MTGKKKRMSGTEIYIIGFIVGLVIGSLFGFFISALMAVSDEEDDNG